jgi:uncharacterized membrane protein (Fun14 family)
MIDFISQFFLSLGIGGLGGFFIGFATKKIIKILMFFAGLYLLSLFYLMHIDVIKIDTPKLLETSSSLITQVVNFLSSTIAYLPISGSFAFGFILGIVKG